jgi:hypothetical protein
VSSLPEHLLSSSAVTRQAHSRCHRERVQLVSSGFW